MTVEVGAAMAAHLAASPSRWKAWGNIGRRVRRERTGVGTSCFEAGAGTVLVAGLVGVLLVLTLGGLALSSAVLASHRARSAADLAALAGAAAGIRGHGSVACAVAADVARAGGATLGACRSSGDELVLTVSVPARWPGLGDAVARSRAGPAP